MKTIVAVLFVTMILLSQFTCLFSNLWSLAVDDNYFIPEESNIFDFNVYSMNDGSGDWWLYGEDDVYYYALNQRSSEPRYFKAQKGKEVKSFDKLNYETW